MGENSAFDDTWIPMDSDSPSEYGLYEVTDEAHPSVVIEARLTTKGWYHRFSDLGHTIPDFFEITHYRELSDG